MTKRAVDHILIEELANGSTQRDAARRARVSESTVQRRLRDPDFCRRLEERRDELLHAREAMRLEYAMAGADELLDVAQNSANDMARVKAAAALLDALPPMPWAASPSSPSSPEPPVTDVIRKSLADMAARNAAAGETPKDPSEAGNTSQN